MSDNKKAPPDYYGFSFLDALSLGYDFGIDAAKNVSKNDPLGYNGLKTIGVATGNAFVALDVLFNYNDKGAGSAIIAGISGVVGVTVGAFAGPVRGLLVGKALQSALDSLENGINDYVKNNPIMVESPYAFSDIHSGVVFDYMPRSIERTAAADANFQLPFFNSSPYTLPAGAATFDLNGRPVFVNTADPGPSPAERDGPGATPSMLPPSWLDPGTADRVMTMPGASDAPSFPFPEAGPPAAVSPGTWDTNFGMTPPSYPSYTPDFSSPTNYAFDAPTAGASVYPSSGYDGGGLGGFVVGFDEPVILDLDGNGARVETLQTSRTYFDMSGNGGRNRTAWASAGDGVLAIDANGDGKINQRAEVVFTDWAEMAANDMQAVKIVFDTNNDGKLSSADARWGSFRVVQDGVVKTLASLGITQKGLNGDTVTADLPQIYRLSLHHVNTHLDRLLF